MLEPTKPSATKASFLKVADSDEITRLLHSGIAQHGKKYGTTPWRLDPTQFYLTVCSKTKLHADSVYNNDLD